MKMLKKSIYSLLPSLAFLTFRGKGGGGGPQNSTSVARQDLDPDVKAKWLDMYGTAETVADRPYVPYTGDMIAGFDPLQTKGFGMYENALGTGAGTLNDAMLAAGKSAGYTPTDVSSRIMGQNFADYMNPYTDQVVDTAMQDMERQRQMMMGDIAGSAQAANAFGGSRHGIAESETNQRVAEEMGQVSAQLRDQGFNTALQGFMGDSRLMQSGDIANQAAGLDANQQQQGAAQLLAGLSGVERDQAFGDSQMMVDLGAEKQGMAQSELDLAYQQFTEEQDHPLRQLETLMSAYGISPQISGTTTTTTKS